MPWAKQAALATSLARDQSAWPYGSLALVALDHNASPLLLISELADHTQNIKADPRVVLLFDGTAGWPDPLAGPRASVLRRAGGVAGPAGALPGAPPGGRGLCRVPGLRPLAGRGRAVPSGGRIRPNPLGRGH